MISLLSHKPGIYTSKCSWRKTPKYLIFKHTLHWFDMLLGFLSALVWFINQRRSKNLGSVFQQKKNHFQTLISFICFDMCFVVPQILRSNSKQDALKRFSLDCLPSKYYNSIILRIKNFLDPRINYKTRANFHLESMHVVHSHITNIFG